MRRASAALLLLTAACQRGGAADDGASSRSGPASSLERAAIETGAIPDMSAVSPVGLYQRSHEAGRDALCVIPGTGGQFRFGMEAVFGEEPSCRGQGVARRAGDKLVLSFRGGARCIVVARYEGDQVALPGVVDMACADVCDGRGTLEGVSFPRIANDAASARKARDRKGDPLCPA